jgi:hypothetical protein
MITFEEFIGTSEECCKSSLLNVNIEPNDVVNLLKGFMSKFLDLGAPYFSDESTSLDIIYFTTFTCFSADKDEKIKELYKLCSKCFHKEEGFQIETKISNVEQDINNSFYSNVTISMEVFLNTEEIEEIKITDGRRIVGKEHKRKHINFITNKVHRHTHRPFIDTSPLIFDIEGKPIDINPREIFSFYATEKEQLMYLLFSDIEIKTKLEDILHNIVFKKFPERYIELLDENDSSKKEIVEDILKELNLEEKALISELISKIRKNIWKEYKETEIIIEDLFFKVFT